MNSDLSLAGRSELHQALLRSPPALATNQIPLLALEIKDLLPPSLTPSLAEIPSHPALPWKSERGIQLISISATNTNSVPWRLLTQV